MKKIALLLFVIQSGIMMAQQQETVVTVNGKKVTFYSSYIGSVDNGLTLSTPSNVQLGGVLTQPSVLSTTSAFTLAIKGLVPKATISRLTDNVVMTGANGTLRAVNAGVLSNEPWYNAVDNLQAWQNNQNIYIMGNVGIGQTTASTKLDIKSATAGAIKIVDGTQTNGYILTSDANGKATWKVNEPSVKLVNGTLPQIQTDLNTASPIYFGSSIVLPKGSWAIYVGLLIAPKTGLTRAEANTNYVSRFTLSDQNNSISEATFSYITPNKYSYNVASTGPTPAPFALFNKGIIRVTTTERETTLYLLSTGKGSAIGSVVKNDENYFYALKINL